MAIGLRKHERVAAPQLQKGKLYLDSNMQCFPVQIVQDASLCGIGLVVDGVINNGEMVHLGFTYNNNRIHMHGRIVWSNPVDANSGSMRNDPVSRLGINLC